MTDLTFGSALIAFVRHIICLSLLSLWGCWGRWRFGRLAAIFDFGHQTFEHDASDALISVACNLCNLLKVDL